MLAILSNQEAELSLPAEISVWNGEQTPFACNSLKKNVHKSMLNLMAEVKLVLVFASE